MTTTPTDDAELVWPPAVQHANYRGKLSTQLGRVMGPMLQSDSAADPQYLTVVEQTYDPASNMTRLGLTYGLAVPTHPDDDGETT